MRNKKKLCAGILMLLLLTGCSSQEVLQEVPQTIVLPESQIDTMPVQETAAAENDNTESFSLLEEEGSRFAYESLDAQEQIWYQEIEQAIGSMDDTIKLSTEPLEQGMDEQDIDKVFQCVLIDHPEIFYTTGYTYTKYSRGEKTVGIDFAGTYDQTKEEAVARAEAIRSVTAEWLTEAVKRLRTGDFVVVDRLNYNKAVWQDVVGRLQNIVSFDMYYCGLVYVDPKRYKQNYKINF